MKDFWKNEWDLFLDDMQTLGEFFLQPVTLTSKPAQLQASVEERVQDLDQIQNAGVWESFKQGLSNAKDFLFQPVKFN